MVHAPLDASVLESLALTLDRWVRAEAFEFVNLPWLVPQRYLDATKPLHLGAAPDIATPFGSVVASGEQAFLQMWEEGRLLSDQGYIGWTPCVRQEPVFDELHHYYFVKAELFCVPTDDPRIAVERMVCGSHTWFCELLHKLGRSRGHRLEVSRIDDTQTDVLLNGVEIGSYGMRLVNGQAVVFGTALAEPRFTTACTKRSL